MLKLKNVSKYYYQDGVVAKGISNVNLELHLGEFVVITGESGSGKSTLLNVLSGLDSYEDGEMYINGEETSHYTEEDYLKYRRSYVSNIFQNFNLVNSYTVYENIELAFLMNGYNRGEIKKKVNELIEKVGLKKHKNTHTSKLSGGEKQRVAIARALANNTPIIVADEPTGSLDSKASKEILKILHDIAKEKLVIIVTHNKSEVEDYATRIIRMHDGNILENKVINEINLDHNVQSIKVNDITFISKIRLGFRNAFNIPIKFLLMFMIFLLITITLITNYGSFKLAEYEEIEGYSPIFNNLSDQRIVINKQNKEAFTNDDYDEILKIKGVDYLVKEDLVNDYQTNINNDYTYLNGNLYLKEINYVDQGKVPSKSNEIVIVCNKDNYYIDESEVLNKSFYLNNNELVYVSGILYDNSYNLYNMSFYLKDELREKIYLDILKNYSNLKYSFDNVTFNEFDIQISDQVKKGEVYISDDIFDQEKIGKTINIEISNVYEKNSLNLKIKGLYNDSNIKKLLNTSYIDNYLIYISYDDYVKLIGNKNYQSSVFVKDIKDLDYVCNNLNKLGINTLKIRDAKSNDAELVNNVVKIFKLIVTICLVLTLFFISYFIMRIIYKARNSYYTTLRTLGSTKNVCINILMNELITLATFTYIFFIILIILIKNNLISNEYLSNITKYVSIFDYIIVYLILILISVLMSLRYGRKIFKESIIKTYKEKI